MSVLNFCHLSVFSSLTFAPLVTSPRLPVISPVSVVEEKQSPHALFYLPLLSNDGVHILVGPPAPKDSIYQDKHKINTLPTQTAHGRLGGSAADAGSGPAVITKAEMPEKKSTFSHIKSGTHACVT